MNYTRLFKRYLIIKAKILLQYRAGFLLGLFGTGTTLLLNFLFWGTIYSYTNQINGWTFGQILMLQGFFYFFSGIFWTFFHFSEHIDELVIHGELDKFLARPINPVIGYMFQYMTLFPLTDIIMGAAYVIISLQMGVAMSLLNFFGACIMLALGSLLFALIMTSIGTLSFWFGRISSMEDIWSSIFEASSYPITIYPITAQLLFTFGIPLIFLQTYPTLFTTQQISLVYFLQLIVMEIVLIIIWLGINTLLWRKGLKRYSSYGG